MSQDRFEPFLEPLYIPALFSLAWILIAYFLNPFEIGDFTVVGTIAIFGTLISSVAVLIYEILLLLKIIRPRAFFSTSNVIYRYARWLLAILGSWAIISALGMLLQMGAFAYGHRFVSEGKG